MKTQKNFKNMRPSTLLQLGLILSMAITLAGFEYVSVDVKTSSVMTGKMTDMEVEFVPELKVEKPEPPKTEKPKTEHKENLENPSKSSEQFNNNIEKTNNKKEIDENKAGFGDGDTIGEIFFAQDTIVTDSIFTIVEFMPTYEEFLSERDVVIRQSKTDTKTKNLIVSEISYPEIPRKMGIQGTVYVSYVVSKTGEITDVKIARSVHPDLDKAALNSVSKLPRMVPGKQRGNEVMVRYIVPVKFILDKN